jgi:hypothetical protein
MYVTVSSPHAHFSTGSPGAGSTKEELKRLDEQPLLELELAEYAAAIAN